MSAANSPRPAASSQRLRFSHRGVLLRALLGLVIVVGCEEVLVSPVPVASVRLAPDSAELFVDDTVTFEAQLLDDANEPLAGRVITWTSADPSVATADTTGTVVGVGPGVTQITASSEGQSAAAPVVVLRRPRIGLGRGSVAFSAIAGSGDPMPVAVDVTNEGDGALDALALAVAYDTTASGWLDATLDSMGTPTSMTVAARTGALEPGTYAATVEVSDTAAENSPATLDISFQVQERIPTAPTELTTTEVSAGAIALSWTDNSDNETEFQLHRQAPDEETFSLLATRPADSSSYEDSAVDPDGLYLYRARACNESGCSAFSNQATGTTPPIAPSALAVTSVTTEAVQLSWTDNSTTETRFEVQRSTDGGSFTGLPAAADNDTTYADSTVSEDTPYAYRIRACNTDGCSPYTAEVTTTTPPRVVSGLTATTASDTAIALSWADSSTTETEFRIERRTGTDAFAQVGTAPADTTHFTDTGLTPATAYDYRVLACNASGCAAPSDTASASTSAIPAPSGLTTTVVSASQIDLDWTDNSDIETRFNIERGAADGTAFDSIDATLADVTSYSDVTTVEDTAYSYRVAACNADGCSGYSNAVTDTTPPTAASGLTVGTVTDSTVDLSWTDNSGFETEFRVERSTDGGTTFAEHDTVAAEVTSYVDRGLDPLATYDYRVVACNGSGCAAASASVSATTDSIPAPSGLGAAVVSASQVDLSWTDNSTTETEFQIERSTDGGAFTFLASVGADSTTYSDETTGADTEYAYRVAACNADGCSTYSSEAAATTPPNAASGLGATVVSAGQVDLGWTDNSDTETRFNIERGTAAGTAFDSIDAVAADDTTYSDLTTVEDTTYTYRVAACNGGDCAAYSNEVTATTPPTAASEVAVSTVSDSTLEVTWSDNSGFETEFRIERRTGTDPFAQVGTVPADTTRFLDSGLAEATSYDYRVLACNAAGCAAPSDTATGTTSDVPPAAPSGLSATTDTTGDDVAIDLAWTDNSDNEDEFEVERRIGSGSFNLLATTGAGVVAYRDTATSADTEYAYRVRACNTAGCSEYSSIDVALTPPTAPTNPDATAVSDDRIDLTWSDASATETSFEVYRRTGTNAFSQVATTSADVTSHTSTGLEPSTAYDFLVRACNSGGCSAFSDTATATTLDTPPPNDPSDLTATLSANQDTVTLNWTDNSGDEDEFRIDRSIDGGTFTQRATVGANTQTFTDTVISVDDRYTYRVEACNTAGCSNFSNEDSVVTEPVAASGLGATFISNGQIDLAWTDNSDTEDEFRIGRRVDGGTFAALDTVPTDTTSFSDTTTVEDTNYAYRVQACNITGCAAYSGEASVTTQPSAASDVNATATSDTSIDLSWTDNSDTETEFRIQRRISGGYQYIDTVGAGVSSYADGGLTPLTTYDYRIEACNASGCADPSMAATATTDSIPAPSALAATVVSATQVDLSWTDNSGTETEFEVQRSTDGGTTFSTLATVLEDVTSYSDGTTTADTDYSYRVRACDDTSCSSFSNQVDVTTPPNAPSGLAMVVVSTGQIDLSWTDNSDTETRFNIERSTDGATFDSIDSAAADDTVYSDLTTVEDTEYTYRVAACNTGGCSAYSNAVTDTTAPSAASGLTVTAVTDSTVDLSWTDNSSYETEFRVERRTGTDAFAQVGTTGTDVSTFTDTNVNPDTTYDYRVLACNSSGCAAASDTATATTDPIPAPSSLSATAAADTTIALSWVDNSTTETRFNIERSTDGGVTFALLDSVGVDVTSYSDLSTAEDTEYTYQVQACDDASCSAYSNTATDTTPPSSATDLTATAVSDTEIDLAWSDSSDTETGFEVWRGLSGGTLSLVTTTAADVESYSDTGLSPSTSYDYEVLACNGSGCAAAATATASTTESPPSAPGSLSATVNSSTEVELSWTDVATENNYTVERSTDGGTTYTEIASLAADVTGYIDSAAAEDTDYTYRVSACNDGGCSSSTTTASTPLTPPDALTVTSTTASQVDLSWTDNSAAETEYRVERSVDGGAFEALDTLAADAQSYADATVGTDTTYGYRVRACNADGCSDYSGEVSTTTPPTAASAVTVGTVTDSSVALSWTDNSVTEDEFQVERRTGTDTFAQVGTVAANTTTFTDTGLNASTSYDYRVLACNGSGCTVSADTATATTDPIPAPSSLTATAAPDTTIDLAWTDNSTTETKFYIERGTDGGVTFALLDSVGVNVTSYLDATTVEDTEYSYRVQACDDASCSAYSNTATDTTPPTAASGLTATATSDTTIDLSWTDNSTYETEFRVERSTDGGSTFVDHDTVTAGVTTYTDSGLDPATTYHYRVVACNNTGCADPSASASATTDSIPAPSSLSATVQSANQIDLAWTDNSTTETKFYIERGTDGGVTFAVIDSTAADVSTYSDLSTVEDTEYSYRVQACDASTCSDYSNTATDTTPPTAASGLTVTAVTDSTVDLSWTDNSAYETEFRVERRTGTDAFAQVGTTGTDVSAFTDATVSPSTTYDYRVLACNGSGCGAPSDTATATTDPIPAPSSLTATAAADTTIDLTWTDNSTTETRFNIERGAADTTAFDSIDATLADITSYSDLTTLEDTVYTYRVAACNADGCSAYSNVATDTTPPSTPTNLTATTVSSSQIDLGWDDTSYETSFEIERRPSGGTFSLIDTVTTDVVSYSDTGLTADTTYEYQIRACNASGCSAYTLIASATTDP